MTLIPKPWYMQPFPVHRYTHTVKESMLFYNVLEILFFFFPQKEKGGGQKSALASLRFSWVCLLLELKVTSLRFLALPFLGHQMF